MIGVLWLMGLGMVVVVGDLCGWLLIGGVLVLVFGYCVVLVWLYCKVVLMIFVFIIFEVEIDCYVCYIILCELGGLG